MKLTQILSIALFTSTYSLLAQDVITKMDSTKINAIVKEISNKEIKYVHAEYTDGPLVVISKSDVAYILYKTGLAERFEAVRKVTANDYNLDKRIAPVVPTINKNTNTSELYQYKNYVGFNCISFLNYAIGINYMRDISKANLILNIPLAVGFSEPALTTSLFGRNSLGGNNTRSQYDLMRFQVGVNALFTPSFNKQVNFLFGPSFLHTQYEASCKTDYSSYNMSTNQTQHYQFANSFVINRAFYGITIGLMARINKHFNINALFTYGYKKDTYSKKDPFGYDYINQQPINPNNYYYSYYQMPKSVQPYVNVALSLGYRF